MKRKYFLLLSVLAGSFYMTGSSCQNKNNTDQKDDQVKHNFTNPDSAARLSLTVLQGIVSNEKLKGTIPLSPEEVRQLTLGQPIAVQELSYDELLKAPPDSVPPPPAPDPMQQTRWLYPLQIDSSVKTTAVVSKSDDYWKLSSTGDNSYVELLSAQKPEGASVMSLIEVPGLSVRFLRYVVNGAVFYASDRDLPEAKIGKGRLMPEQQALQSLAAYAHVVDQKYGKDIRDKKAVD